MLVKCNHFWSPCWPDLSNHVFEHNNYIGRHENYSFNHGNHVFWWSWGHINQHNFHVFRYEFNLLKADFYICQNDFHIQKHALTNLVYMGFWNDCISHTWFPCLLHAKWLISKSRDIELTFEDFLYIKRLWCSGTGIHSNSKGHSSHVLSMAPETLQLLTSYSVLAPAVASPTSCGQQELYIEPEGWGILEMHSISGCNWSQNTFTLLNLTKSGRGMASICSSARLKLYFQPLPAVTFLYCFLWNFPSISHLPT